MMLRKTIAVFLLLTLTRIGQVEAAPSCTVGADLRPKATTILPGQALEPTMTLRNVSGAAVSLSNPSVLVGTVTVETTEEQSPGAFKRYFGPRWGLRDGRHKPLQLGAGASVDVPLRILYHSVPNTLDPDPTKDILTPFAFSTPGKYLLRANYEMDPTCGRVSSQPINVQVLTPSGDDLSVWNAIKDCQECAYFLDTGHAMSDQADQQVAALLRSLIKQYPKSRYSKLFRKQLDALDKSSGDHNGDGHPDQGKPPTGD